MTLPNVPSAPAPTQAVGTSGAPVLPRVNLLPPEIAAAARFRRFQMVMAGAGVATVAVVGLLGYASHQSVNHARANLASARAEQASLQSQVAGLQSVRDVYAQVAAKKAMLSQAMGPEIRWSYYLTDLSLKVPDKVWLSSVTATEGGASPAAGAAPAAAAAGTVPGSIGTVSFSGVAFAHDDVAAWLDMLAKERGFNNAYFSNSTEADIAGHKVVNFTSSANLTSSSLSGRYAATGG